MKIANTFIWCPMESDLQKLLIILCSEAYRATDQTTVKLLNSEISSRLEWAKKRTAAAIDGLYSLSVDGEPAVLVGEAPKGGREPRTFQVNSKLLRLIRAEDGGILKQGSRVLLSGSKTDPLDSPSAPTGSKTDLLRAKTDPVEVQNGPCGGPKRTSWSGSKTDPVEVQNGPPEASGSPMDANSEDFDVFNSHIRVRAQAGLDYKNKEEEELQGLQAAGAEPTSWKAMTSDYGKATQTGPRERVTKKAEVEEEREPEVELPPELQELKRLRDTDVEAWKARIKARIKELEDMGDEDPLTEFEKFGTKEDRRAMQARKDQESREAVWREKFPGEPIPAESEHPGFHIVKEDGRRILLTPEVALRAIGYDIPFKTQGALN